MTLEEKIMEDLKVAMKAKDEVALRSIRAVKAAILLAKTDGSGQAFDEAREVQLVQKLVKQRKESLEIFERESREDLAQKEREEIAIIEKYLPKQMDEAEIEAALRPIIAEVGASSLKDLGKVMGIASKQLAGKADGKLISQIVKRLLEN
ncbi:MAG TPA: GatB/YqeY domain-containing protein [Saprospiraceae bacterium]|nr:GatB/YqeY domain-containing protein [Saprospiraceae bacterium]HMP13273.1 GatB/YqeY domain-containing protein [Saprospiraceae bacterium]